MLRLILIVGVILTLSLPAAASVRVDGSFTPSGACEAFHSFRHQSDSTTIRLQSGQRYDALETNQRDGDWVRIAVPDGSGHSQPYWVLKSCGSAQISGWVQSADARLAQCQKPNQEDSYVLALGWQPGFCEHTAAGHRAPECKAIKEGELLVSHLTLHGLWPNQQICGKSYGSCSTQPMELTDRTLGRLRMWMPSLRFSQDLARHEWLKHGTCQALDDDAYFSTAVELTEKVDQSVIGQLIRGHIGEEMETEILRQRIIDSMGAAAAKRVQLVCMEGRYLTEVRVNLSPVLNTSNKISTVMKNGPEFKSFAPTCSYRIYIEASGKDVM